MKNAIIIGASSGIGRALAFLLAKDNYKVAITGRNKMLLDNLKKSNPEAFIVSSFDATDLISSIEKLEELLLELKEIDLMIFCSGTGDLNEELDFQIEKNTIDLNVVGFTNIIGWTFRYFQKRGFGHIVAISSMAGIRGNRSAPAYNASKSYQINYLEGLRQKATNLKKIFI